jgi:hypothetical protein
VGRAYAFKVSNLKTLYPPLTSSDFVRNRIEKLERKDKYIPSRLLFSIHPSSPLATPDTRSGRTRDEVKNIQHERDKTYLLKTRLYMQSLWLVAVKYSKKIYFF